MCENIRSGRPNYSILACSVVKLYIVHDKKKKKTGIEFDTLKTRQNA